MSTGKNTALKAVTLDHPVNRHATFERAALTPELAEKWLGRNHGNRNLRGGKLNVYTRDMRNGHWLFTGDTIKFDWDGRMIDGQHRCEAVIASGETIDVLVVRGLDPRVQDVLDVNAARSIADALRFNGYDKYVSIMASAAPIAMARAEGYLSTADATAQPSITHSEALEWIAENPSIVNAAALASETYKSLDTLPSSLAYAIWRLQQIDGPAATSFFTTASQMMTNGPGDPRHTLVKKLRSFRDEGVRNRPAMHIHVIFRTWNAWRDKTRITNIPLSTRLSDGSVHGVRIPEPK